MGTWVLTTRLIGTTGATIHPLLTGAIRMLASIALLISTAMANPDTVEEAMRLHLDGRSVQAAELILPEIDQDPAAALALGRIFFAHSQWALAEAAYHRVPRESPLWFRSRLEATWAVYYLDPTHERAIARALLLYLEDPIDPDLRYLIGVLTLHCGRSRTGRVGRLAGELVKELIEESKSEIKNAPHPSPTARLDLVAAAEVLWWEIAGPIDHGMYVYQPKCGWASLDAKPQADAFSLDSSVTRAILLTLGGEQGRRPKASDGCSVHGVGLVPQGSAMAGSPRCPDPRADRKRDREAWRWLRSYRDDLD